MLQGSSSSWTWRRLRPNNASIQQESQYVISYDSSARNYAEVTIPSPALAETIVSTH